MKPRDFMLIKNKFLVSIGYWSPNGRELHRIMYPAFMVFWRFRGRDGGFHVKIGRSFVAGRPF